MRQNQIVTDTPDQTIANWKIGHKRNFFRSCVRGRLHTRPTPGTRQYLKWPVLISMVLHICICANAHMRGELSLQMSAATKSRRWHCTEVVLIGGHKASCPRCDKDRGMFSIAETWIRFRVVSFGVRLVLKNLNASMTRAHMNDCSISKLLEEIPPAAGTESVQRWMKLRR